MPLKILYNIVCDGCGEIANPTWLDSGLESFRWAYSHEWTTAPGNEFRCPKCAPEAVESELAGEPQGYKKPPLWCGKCKSGKCKACKKLNREI